MSTSPVLYLGERNETGARGVIKKLKMKVVDLEITGMNS